MSAGERAWSRIWTVWTVTVVGSFTVLEGVGLVLGHPYSRVLAEWLGCHPVRRHRPIAVAAFALGWAWLTAHLVRYGSETRP